MSTCSYYVRPLGKSDNSSPCAMCGRYQAEHENPMVRYNSDFRNGLRPTALQKHDLDTVDVRHHSTAGKIPVGIKWNPEEWRVPEDYKKRLRLVFAGYVRQAISLKLYPTILGDGFELKPGKNDLVKELWWTKWHVGELIENPTGDGLPFDGKGLPPPREQKLLAAPQKQEEPKSEHPGFGWDPGYGDD